MIRLNGGIGNDGMTKSQLYGFFQTLFQLRYRANLSAQTDLTDQNGMRIHNPIPKTSRYCYRYP
jgi:hypothetical protein